ncbi:MAG: 50S ribosomal protein L9 [Rhodospirillaceae bacterium]|jgi:large subunit ribosomal protein L9|nr:50S ribosomal protein L9 [Rhodospirillaceae bacterium]MBT6136792.1 50S ribosomal protein L9 [Rhodospirillaceae bacterium]
MEVILLQRIERLGQMGEVVTVKAGYARNYLLPQSKALRATKANLEVFEGKRTQLEAENLENKGEAGQIATKLDGLNVPMIRAAGDSGQLYGSVTARDIAAAITEAGVSVTRQQVVLDRAIKALGLEEIRVQLHPEVSVSVTVNIARSTEEAEQQKKLGRAIGSHDEEEAFAEEEARATAEATAAAEELFENPEDAAAAIDGDSEGESESEGDDSQA